MKKHGRTRFHGWLLGLCLPLAGLRAQVLPNLQTNIMPSTVTAEMGDVGGKFFGQPPDPARTRRYYIAAESQLWDYAPEGRDPICGKPFPTQVTTRRNGGKIRYIQYTDATFTTRLFENKRLGVLGPVLRGVVGDYLAVTFLNRTARPLSMHPHGVKYDKDSEGAYYLPKPGLGASVGPRGRFTYVWKLDENSGPLSGEPASKGWLYHSHVNAEEEANLGLMGFLIVTDPMRARTDGTPDDTDREMAALFMIFDESGLGEDQKEAGEYAAPGMKAPPPIPWAKVQELTELGQRSAINGMIFGNLPGLEMNEGERVRWYVFGLGSERDVHSAHWHGLRVTEDGRRRTDVVELLPASMKVADMLADNPGSWLLHCHVAEHMQEGMFARFIVHPRGTKGAGAESAFFGLSAAASSMQIQRSEVLVPPALAEPADCELRFTGAISVFDAFSVFTQTITAQIGQTSAVFKPDRRGEAQIDAGSFKVKNASQFGVVYGALMEFEMSLRGAGWLSELRKLGLSDTRVKGTVLQVPLTMRVGKAEHTTTARVTVTVR